MDRRTENPLLLALAALTLLFAVSVTPETRADTPLLQPGKKTLYERVLTRPGARLAATINDIGPRDNKLVDAFSQFYVYERQSIRGQTWLRIGTDTEGRYILGWVDAAHVVPWKQQLTLALTNPGTVRDRLLFFTSKRALERVLESPQPTAVTRPLIRRLERGERDERVVALEPKHFVDISKRFYLLPVLEHEQFLTTTGDSVRLLKIASVTEHEPGMDAPAEHHPATGASPPKPRQGYKAAVVFVVDSTISMGPYIEETKEAVTQVYKRLRDAHVLDRVRFGLVAFRAKTESDVRNRQLGYVATKFVDPSEVGDSNAFLERVKGLQEAKVATQYYDEDAFAGVVEALDNTKWDEFDARHIVLITDAGALDGSMNRDAQGRPVESTTGLDAARIASIAGEKQVAITVFHLRTPAGAADHRHAEEQYRILASNARFQTEAYLPIMAGSVKDYGAAVKALSDSIIANVTGTNEPSERTNDRPAPPPQPQTPAVSAETQRSIREIANALGHAMRLRYLGEVSETKAPTLLEAWISDRDFADPTKKTVEVRVLLTKNQLSDLQLILKKIVTAAEAGMLKPERFYDSLRSLAAQFGRDPNLARSEKATKLADLGLLGEYLDDLPYQSQVMGLTQDTWIGWGPEKQTEFISMLKRKLRLYERYNEDWENWIDLGQTATGGGDIVYPIPLEDMP